MSVHYGFLGGGITQGSARDRAQMRQIGEDMVALLEQKGGRARAQELQAHITQTIPLSEVPAGLERLRQGGGIRGKIVMEIDQ